jgi:hypothetical protein
MRGFGGVTGGFLAVNPGFFGASAASWCAIQSILIPCGEQMPDSVGQCRGVVRPLHY